MKYLVIVQMVVDNCHNDREALYTVQDAVEGLEVGDVTQANVFSIAELYDAALN